jgi:hypothetical protein
MLLYEAAVFIQRIGPSVVVLLCVGVFKTSKTLSQMGILGQGSKRRSSKTAPGSSGFSKKVLLRLIARLSIDFTSISIASSCMRFRDSARSSGLGDLDPLSRVLPREMSSSLPLPLLLDRYGSWRSSSVLDPQSKRLSGSNVNCREGIS